MKNASSWLLFQQCFGYGTTTCSRLLEQFGHPREIFDLPAEEREAIPGLSGREKAAVRRAAAADTEKILEFCAHFGCQLLTPDDREYPQRLRNIYAPPAVLYVLGELRGLDDALAIAVVGTRRYTDYGRRAAETIAGQLAARGVVIVSGMALGIDGIAQAAALRAGGRTIAVTGSGIDVIYPRENETLAKQIVEKGGAVITEFPPGARPMAYHFPIRNRVISGLCQGTLVVEGSRRSGSLITAGHALAQDRDVFAVPGNIFSPGSAGPNWLISEGAKITCCCADILSEYEHFLPGEPEKTEKVFADPFDKPAGNGYNEPKAQAESAAGHGRSGGETACFGTAALNENQRRVYETLTGGPCSSDQIVAATGLAVGTVLSALTQLEICGLIRVYPGRLFSRR